MDNFTITSPCHFGLEKTLSFEAVKTGGTDITVTDGRIFFKGGAEVIARMNICSSVAERVGILLGKFPADNFDMVFEGAQKAPLEQFCGKNGRFPVTGGHSINSNITSIPALQRTIKKALANRLTRIYGDLPETGAEYPVSFFLNKNEMLLILDTTGDGLHKRGYRAFSNQAPIKETLAAGMADLARVKATDEILDPFCGSGTILIESVYHALRIPPGGNRRFLAESWDCFSGKIWKEALEEARARIIKAPDFIVKGWDIDPASVELSMKNAAKANVGAHIRVEKRSITDFPKTKEPFKLITNPPYGERMGSGETEKLYREMGKALLPLSQGQQLFVICGNDEFPIQFGKKADKNRKLYNGMIKSRLYIYG